MAKTKLDVYQSAALAAAASLTATTEFDVLVATTDAFEKAGLDKVDFPFWHENFLAQRNLMLALGKQDAVSTVLAKQAAAKQAAAAAPAPAATPAAPAAPATAGTAQAAPATAAAPTTKTT